MTASSIDGLTPIVPEYPIPYFPLSDTCEPDMRWKRSGGISPWNAPQLIISNAPRFLRETRDMMREGICIVIGLLLIDMNLANGNNSGLNESNKLQSRLIDCAFVAAKLNSFILLYEKSMNVSDCGSEKPFGNVVIKLCDMEKTLSDMNCDMKEGTAVKWLFDKSNVCKKKNDWTDKGIVESSLCDRINVFNCENENRHLGNARSSLPAALKSINFLHELRLLGIVESLLKLALKSDKNEHLSKHSGSSLRLLNEMFNILKCEHPICGKVSSLLWDKPSCSILVQLTKDAGSCVSSL